MSQDNINNPDVPLVSIVISNWNGLSYLAPCLESILKTRYPNYEVIFIDDASTDGSVQYAKKHFGDNPKIRIIANEENVGLVNVFNRGFKESSGEYIVFMHSDTAVDEYWVSFLVKAMQSDSQIGAAHGKFLSIGNPKIILSAGHTIDYLGVPQKSVGYHTEDRGQFNVARESFDAWDACMIVRRAVLEEVGLFDPMFKYAHEEIDLCWRIHLAGFKTMYIPNAKIMHKSLNVVRAMPYLFTFHMAKNYIITLIKNYNSKNLVMYLPVSTVFLLARALFEALVANPRYSLALIKGLCWVLFHASDVWRERLLVQKNVRKVSDDEIKSLMCRPDWRLYLARSFFKEKRPYTKKETSLQRRSSESLEKLKPLS